MPNNHRKCTLHLGGARRKTKSRRLTMLRQQIDQLVYKLYGLTLEEIAVVEGKN